MADTKQVKLDKIRTDGETQSRVEIDTNVVADYQADIEAGTTLPPADVYHDGAATWLADGFHRYFAYKRAGKDEMPCIIHEGTQKDAQWHSVGSNKGHGLRRSNADKQNAVRMALDLHDERSDSAIATHVGVSDRMVAKYRAELTPKVSESTTREGKDGRKIKTGKIGNATRDELISGLTKRAKVPAKGASLPEVRKLAELEEEDQDAVADAMRKHEADTVTEAISMLRSQPPVDPFQEPDEEAAKPENADLGKCPNCAGTKWQESDDGPICAKCQHPHGESTGGADDDRVATQRSKTVKTCEALMRAFDDLQLLLAKPEHDEAISSCKTLLKMAKSWK